MIPEFYTPRPDWPGRIEIVLELLGRISAMEDVTGRRLELRRANRLDAVHSSTAIEGNQLTQAQVAAVASGEPVFAPPREVKEVENAFAAYDALVDLDPWNVDDFLRAHALLTTGLIAESGAFRTVDVDIVNAHGNVIHTGSRAEKVPRLVTELLDWGRLGASSAGGLERRPFSGRAHPPVPRREPPCRTAVADADRQPLASDLRLDADGDPDPAAPSRVLQRTAGVP